MVVSTQYVDHVVADEPLNVDFKAIRTMGFSKETHKLTRGTNDCGFLPKTIAWLFYVGNEAFRVLVYHI